MNSFRQAAPDPEKASRDGVSNYIPARSQVNTDHKCADCPRTATWQIKADGHHLFACNPHRREYAISAINYEERKL